jgi:FkbM family methyltransferase
MMTRRLRVARWLSRQRWIRRGKDRLLRMLVDPDGRNYPFVTDFFGLRYSGNSGCFIDWTVFMYGCFAPSELSVLDTLSKCLQQSQRRVVYLDIGTNVGHHLLFMSPRADFAYGFDPYPAVLEKAREKLAINNTTNTWLYGVGLGERDQTMVFFPPKNELGGSGSILPDWQYGINSRGGIEVQIRAASQFLDENNIRDISIIKIDVEGAEASVLRGLTQVVRRDRPFVLLELSPRGAQELGSQDAFEACFCDGAAAFLISGQGRSLAHTLTPYRFQTQFESLQELLVVPPEYREVFYPSNESQSETTTQGGRH